MDIASIYTSLEEVNWNIMIRESIHETCSHNVTISFHEQVESTQPSESEDTGFADYIRTYLIISNNCLCILNLYWVVNRC
jgi:hypothetical protein